MNLLFHSILHALEHGASSCQNYVFEEIFLDVIITLHNRIEGILVDSLNIFIQLLDCLSWLEKDLWASQSLLFQIEGFISREHVFTFNCLLFTGSLHLSIKVLGNDTHSLFDISDNLHVIGRVSNKVRSFLIKDFVKKFCYVSPREWDLLDGMRDSITLIDWDCMSDSIS